MTVNTVYHNSPVTGPGVCHATKRACRFGQHYPTLAQATEAWATRTSGRDSIPKPARRPTTPRHPTPEGWGEELLTELSPEELNTRARTDAPFAAALRATVSTRCDRETIIAHQLDECPASADALLGAWRTQDTHRLDTQVFAQAVLDSPHGGGTVHVGTPDPASFPTMSGKRAALGVSWASADLLRLGVATPPRDNPGGLWTRWAAREYTRRTGTTVTLPAPDSTVGVTSHHDGYSGLVVLHVTDPGHNTSPANLDAVDKIRHRWAIDMIDIVTQQRGERTINMNTVRPH